MQVYCMSKYGVEPGKGVFRLTQKFVVYQSTLVAYSAAALLLKQDFFDDALSGVMDLCGFGFLSPGVRDSDAAAVFLSPQAYQCYSGLC